MNGMIMELCLQSININMERNMASKKDGMRIINLKYYITISKVNQMEHKRVGMKMEF